MKTLVKINPNKKFFLPLLGCFSNQATEIVILDPTVPDSNHIASGIKPGTATYILESQPDAIEQITTLLARHTSIEALHIITHGSPGSLYLGTTELNSSNIENYSQQLQQWRNSFSANASIILYGCSVAGGETGHQFLTQLHQLTGANITANPHTTGNAALGGTWKLISFIPPSPQAPKLALTETALKTYSGILGFAPKVDFPTGDDLYSVSIGDFNGDGSPDVATANRDSSTTSILLNTTPTGATTPTFAPKVDFPTGTGAVSVSIGDFNGDGSPDVATANRDNNTSILLNTTPTGATTPTFAPKVDFPTGSVPNSVSIGDFNGDGSPDVAVANRFNGTTSILLNNTPTGATTPTFAPKVDFPTGSSYSVSIGDFNGDGKPDVATANHYSNTTSILLNTTPTGATTPTFAPKVDFPTGNRPTSVSIGDFNDDGSPDVAVANTNSNTTSILLNTTPTGATTPTLAPKVDFTTGAVPSSVSIGDFNGDGKPDVAVANRFNNTTSILLNTTPKVTAVTATTADGSYGVGSTIVIAVTFDAAVNVTGTPQLQLETGTTDQFATYISGSGGTALTFNYVVQAGDTSADLEYLATNALTLNGGTIKETAGSAFDAFFTLPTLASANSLGGSKAIVIDGVAPTITSVTSTTANGSYNTTNNINVTVNFSEAVTLAGGNMTVALDTGGTVTIAPFTGTSAVGSYTPAAGQNSTDLNSTGITLAVGATLRDAAGNNATTLTIPAGQSLANSKAIVVDTVVPTVALTSASPTTTNAPFLVTATFSESVTGFIASDVNLTNSTISNFTGSGTTYNFTVTPTASAPITADVLAARATDTAGNNNTAATQLTRTADITAPTVTLTSASPTATNAPFLVTATFSESVTGFSASDVNLTNSTISNFTGSGTTYNFTVTPNADGNVTVNVPAAIATDTAGNNNIAATQLTRTADITAPTVTLTSTSTPTVTGLFSVTATFNEDVIGFDNTDITVANATVGNFVKVDAKTYTFEVTPTADGNVTVDVLAAKATDTAGNNNTAATGLTRSADFTAPTVILTSAPATRVNAPFSVTATFSEDVTGFDNTDITVANATVDNFVTLDAKTYSFDVTPTADGNVTVDVLAAQATDTAGNNNTAATGLTRSADFTAPTVILTSAPATRVNAPFSVTATFSEDVTGFDNTDITVANATVDNFVTLDAKTYSFDVTPTADGNVTVDVLAAQ